MRIFLSRPHMSGKEEVYVSEAFSSNYVAPLGPQLDAFEAEVARYLGQDLYCVGLSSGSAALHLALRIAGVAEGDEVWISSMTFAGGIFPVNYLGANPRFFDLNLSTWCIDIEILANQLDHACATNSLPKVIVATELYGQPVDIDDLEALAAKFDVKLVIDSAESFGALYSCGRKVGSGGDAAILSFNGNKIITTSGGGMLVTKHREWADQARFLATQAREAAPHYEHITYGYNYRMSNICAAIGLGQMEVLDSRVMRRRQIFERYQVAIDRPGLSFMPQRVGSRSSRWLTAITIDPLTTGINREQVRLRLLSHGIESRPLWKPMHLQPLYSGCPYHGNGIDERLFQQGLCLPSGSDMSNDQQDEVIACILNLLDNP